MTGVEQVLVDEAVLGCRAGEPAAQVAGRLAAGASAARADRELVAELLGSALAEVDLDPQEPGTDPAAVALAARIIDVCCELTLSGAVTEVAQALWLRAVRTDDPAATRADLLALLAVDWVSESDLVATAHAVLAEASAHLQLWSDAVEAWRTAYRLEEDPASRGECALELAGIVIEHGQALGAAAVLELTAELLKWPELAQGEIDPTPFVHCVRGLALAESGDYGRAVEQVRVALSQVSELSDRAFITLHLVEVLEAQGRPVEAADLAWGIALECEGGPDWDADDWADTIALQWRAIDTVRQADRGAPEVMRLIERTLTRTDVWPEVLEVGAVHVAAAQACAISNDLAGARRHIAAAEAELAAGRVQETAYFTAELQLTAGETAVLQGDTPALERAVRSVRDHVVARGDAEQRERFATLVKMLSYQTTGQAPGQVSQGYALLTEVFARLGQQQIDEGDLARLDRARGSFTEDERHLDVLAQSCQAMLLATTGRHPEAARMLSQAREAWAALTADPPGGLPRVETWLDLTDGVLAAAKEPGGLDVAVHFERLWRASLAGSRTVLPAFAACAAGAWLHANRVQAALPPAVASVTAMQELRYTSTDSRDRAIVARRTAAFTDLLVDVVERLGDSRVVAEAAEVLRAQWMPAVSDGIPTTPIALLLREASALTGSAGTPAEPAAAGVLDAPTAGLGAAASVEHPQVRLPPPPLVVMPWGTVALGPWLCYNRQVARDTAYLVVGLDEHAGDLPG